MKWNRKELIDLLERTISGQEIGDDWEDLGRCAIRSTDAFTKYWGRKIIAVENLYPRRTPTELFNEDGLQYLKNLLIELRK